MKNLPTVGIAGLGLIGGSLALTLVQSGMRVVAWNHHDNPYEEARINGIECVDSLSALAAKKPDVLFLCVPLKAMDCVLEELSGVLDEKTTLSDVGSVKGEVLTSVDRHGLRSVFVGAHPMAGNELAGFAASDAHLFDNAVWAITVEDDTDFQRFLAVARVITHGVHNRFIVTDALTHDKAAAQISHMPHVVATALVHQLQDNAYANLSLALAAGSWRDMTRVAMTTPARTQAMVDENPHNVAVLLRDMANRLNTAADLLDNPLPDNSSEPSRSSPSLHSSYATPSSLQEFFESADAYRHIRAALAQGTPEETSEIVLDQGKNNWRAELAEASNRGGRVEEINEDTARIRHFAAFSR